MMGYTQWQISENWEEATGTAEICTIPDGQRVRLRQGDTLVMLIERRTAPPELQRIRDALDQLFPDNQVLVLDCGSAEFIAIGEGPL